MPFQDLLKNLIKQLMKIPKLPGNMLQKKVVQFCSTFIFLKRLKPTCQDRKVKLPVMGE